MKPCATSAHVAASTAVPNAAAGRDSRSLTVGAGHAKRVRRLWGTGVGWRDGSGSHDWGAGVDRAWAGEASASGSHRSLCSLWTASLAGGAVGAAASDSGVGTGSGAGT